MNEARTWILTDVDNRVYSEDCKLTAQSAGGNADERWSVTKMRLKGGLSDGVDVIDVDNGCLSFTIVPTRGFGLWRGQCGPVRLGWDSPVTAPVNPMLINIMDNGTCGWLRGMNECMVRCGLNSCGAACIDNKPDGSTATVTLHGSIANVPAKFVAVRIVPGTPTRIEITGMVEDARFFGEQYRLFTTYSTEAGSTRISVHDEIVNWADSPVEMEALYHTNFGSPMIGDGAKLVSPSLEIVPRTPHAASDIPTWDTYRGPMPGFEEQVHFHKLAADKDGNSTVMLHNAEKTYGVAMHFNTKQLPCFTQWKNPIGLHEGYVTGIEPGTNFPNPRPFERENGRLIKLAPGQVYPVDIMLEALVSPEQIACTEAAIKALMPAGAKTVLHSELLDGWAPHL